MSIAKESVKKMKKNMYPSLIFLLQLSFRVDIAEWTIAVQIV